MPRPATDNGAKMPAWARVALMCCALLFAGQALWAARRDSVTIDEFVHLPVGLNAWKTGDVSIDPINPHLPRMIAALPLLASRPEFSPEAGMGHWQMGYLLAEKNVANYQALYFAPRAMIVVLALLLGTLVFAWARELYGWPSALASALLFALSPSLVAHGHLVTLDMAGALGFTLALYACWRFLEVPSRQRAVVLGLALGLANLAKLSAFVLPVVVVSLVAWGAVAGRGRSLKIGGWAGRSLLAASVALFVLNLGYGFRGTFAPLSDAVLADGGWLAALAGSAPWLRLPLPLPVINGVDMILNVGKVTEPSYFLAGEMSADGWWYYHLVAYALKTPLPLLLLEAAAFALWLVRRDRAPGLHVLWVAVLALFGANAAFNSLDIGVRHVLPVVPLLLIPAGALVVRLCSGGASSKARRIGTATAALLVAWLAAGSAAVAPRYLQYCNEIAGGAEGCHAWLVDSNIDWGQDLVRLREYIDTNHLPGVYLAYFGRTDPGLYGIRYAPLTPASQGRAVISASLLQGRPYFWFRSDGRYGWVSSGTYDWLQEKRPIDRVGAMLVYELP
jgi:4-amino-4-deoxy-L-arabinose transferase-like glycosyltransferase